MAIDTIVFDWSGVLSDDLECVVEAVNDVLTYLKKEPTTTTYFRENYPDDFIDLWRSLGVTLSRKTIQELYNKQFAANKKDPSKIKPKPINGVENVLAQLADEQRKLIVLSTHPQQFLDKEMMEYRFTLFFSKGNVHGSVYNKQSALRMIPLSPNSIIVGDTAVDMKAGNAAGIIPVGVLTGYQTREYLEHHTKYIIPTLAELPALLKELEGNSKTFINPKSKPEYIER